MNRNSVVRPLFALFLLISSTFCNTVKAGQNMVNHTTDSIGIHHTESQFKASQLILPGAMIAVGAIGAIDGGPFDKMRHSVKKHLDKLRGEEIFCLDDYTQLFPAITYLCMGGRHARHSFKERAVVGATAYMIMASVVNATKYTVRERRPDASTRNSFPSGHTATVFTGAELMREEYGAGWGAGTYTLATVVAFLRMYNGRHWLNDVITGAGVGILSARLAYGMLPIYQRWFHWDNNNSGCTAIVLPSFNPDNKNFAINVTVTF